MGHINFEIMDTDLLWHDLTAMIVFLLLKKHFLTKDSSSEASTLWEQWRWDLEGAGLVTLSERLKDDLFREKFLAAIDESISTINQFKDEIPKEYLATLDNIWNTRFAKNFDITKVNKSLFDLKEAISTHFVP